VRTHTRPLSCSALTVLAACLALLAPSRALAAPGPFAQTGPATAITATTATLTGTVDPAGHGTAYFFAYGLTARYGAATPVQTLPAGPPAPVTANLTGLTPGTVYHFRLFAAHPGRFGEADAGAGAVVNVWSTPASASPKRPGCAANRRKW